MNALIAVFFVLIGTGMGQDVGLLLWSLLASIELLADRCAGWLSKTLSTQNLTAVVQTDAVS